MMGVSANFAEFRRDVLQNAVLDTALFAEVITYKTPNKADTTPTALCDHKDEVVIEHGCEVVVETLRVTIARDAIPCPPARGHKLRRAGEDRDYLFVYNGRNDDDAYRVVFERRRTISERLT